MTIALYTELMCVSTSSGTVHLYTVMMVDRSGMIAIHKQKGAKKRKSVMSSRFERLPDNTASWQPDLTSTGCFVCLLGAVAYVIMSTKKKVSAVVKKTTNNNKRAKKVRSISMSLDLECPGRIPHGNHNLPPPQTNGFPYKKHARLFPDRNRTVSACEFVEQYLAKESLSKSELLVKLARITKNARKIEEERFPFSMLPLDCKLKVLSLLSTPDKGHAAQVCSEWNDLVKTPCVWGSVDTTTFPMCILQTSSNSHECSELCYSLYRQRMKKFFLYVTAVRPVLKRLSFSFDIGDFKDGWLDNLNSLLDSARCQELEFASLNWKESPMKPFVRDSITWSTNDYNELMHRHRHRQRLFVNFFDQFTARAPNVSELNLPFDWSPRSVRALARLQKLRSLVLEKYFVFQSLEQGHLDQVMGALPELTKVKLEVWTPSGRGLLLYSVQHDALRDLDISQCRGFYLSKLTTPSLEVFRVGRHPWNGPIITPDSVNIPCVHQVLAEGAPELRQLNDHVLNANWRENVYPELEALLKTVCSCPAHKTSTFM